MPRDEASEEVQSLTVGKRTPSGFRPRIPRAGIGQNGREFGGDIGRDWAIWSFGLSKLLCESIGWVCGFHVGLWFVGDAIDSASGSASTDAYEQVTVAGDTKIGGCEPDAPGGLHKDFRGETIWNSFFEGKVFGGINSQNTPEGPVEDKRGILVFLGKRVVLIDRYTGG